MLGLFLLETRLLQKMLIHRAVASRFRTGNPDALHVLTEVIILLRWRLRGTLIPARLSSRSVDNKLAIHRDSFNYKLKLKLKFCWYSSVPNITHSRVERDIPALRAEYKGPCIEVQSPKR